MSTFTMVTICDAATGLVKRVVTCSEADAEFQAQAGETWAPGLIDVETHYLDPNTGLITARAAMPALAPLTVTANGVNAVQATGLPNPTVVRIQGTAVDEFTVTDGSLSLTFDTPGTYLVWLDAGAAYRYVRETILAT